MDAHDMVLNLERVNAELHRRILAMRKTIERQAAQLERAVDKAHEIEALTIKLVNELIGELD